jgi:hypothetical protein
MKRLVLHPFLLAGFPIIFLYAQNQEQLRGYFMVLPLVLALAITAALWVSLRFVLKDGIKAGLFISFLLVCFFSYGHCYSFVSGWYLGGMVIGRERYLLPSWGIILIFGLFFISRIKSSKRLTGFSSFLNFSSIFSVLISLSIIAAGILPSAQNPVKRASAHPRGGGEVFSTQENQPDIYYIILDSYGSNTTLKDYFQFENVEFICYLAQKGFYVASRARSNYASTLPSLSSSLNMNYINDSIVKNGHKSWNDKILGGMVLDNSVSQILKARGYRIIKIASGWEIPSLTTSFEGEDDATMVQEGFYYLLLDTTVLHVFREVLLENRVRRNILQAFQKLGESVEVKTPKFVIAHIMCPHPPFVFGPNGEKVSTREMIPGMASFLGYQKRRYIGQLIFTNREVIKAIDTILAKSGTPPIIFLQADHGCAYIVSPEVMDSRKAAAQNLPDKMFLAAQMSILSAFYAPKECLDRLYGSITPVNSFRLILSCCFKQDLPLLEDHSYYSTHKHPYEFVDVTETITATDRPGQTLSPYLANLLSANRQ